MADNRNQSYVNSLNKNEKTSRIVIYLFIRHMFAKKSDVSDLLLRIEILEAANNETTRLEAAMN